MFTDLKVGDKNEQITNLFLANQASLTIRGLDKMAKNESGAAHFVTQKGQVLENKENTTAMNKLADRGLIKSKGDYVESIPLFLDDTYTALYDQNKSLDEPEGGASIQKPGVKKDKGKAGSKLYKM